MISSVARRMGLAEIADKAAWASSSWTLQLLGLGTVLAIAGASYLALLNSYQVGVHEDDAIYVVLARGIAEGKGFVLSNHPGALPQFRYPPGFPLLLLPVALISPDSLQLYRLPSLLLALASIPLWFVVFRRRLSPLLSLLLLLAVSLSPLLGRYAGVPMSEAAFSFFFALLLVLVDRVEDSRWSRWALALAIALCLTALYFSRIVGLAFVAAALAYLAYRRQLRSAVLVGLVFAVPFFAWTLRNLTSPLPGLVSPRYEQRLLGSLGRDNQPAAILERVVGNAWGNATWGLPEALGLRILTEGFSGRIAARAPWFPDAAGLAVTALAGLGYIRRIRAGLTIAELAGAFYVAPLLLWPWVLPRFLHPLLPLICYWFIEGVRSCAEHAPRAIVPQSWWARISATAAIGLLMANLVGDVRELRWARERVLDISVAGSWLAANTAPSSVVMSGHPTPDYLYAQRQTVNYPVATVSIDQAAEAVLQSRANYVVVGPPYWAADLDEAGARMQRMIDDTGQSFRVVFHSPEQNVRVYEVVR